MQNSFRLISLNAHCLSPIFNQAIWNGESGQKCAERIGRQLMDDGNDYDLIGLSEVWDEDAKDRLVTMLSGRYPHYIKKIDGSATMGLGEDSGLMLFSRYPFTPLDRRSWAYSFMPSRMGWIHPNPGWNRMGFVQFNDCDGMDCQAGKGALAVRVQVNGSWAYNIVLTHLQADDNPGVRMSQLNQIRSLILGVFGQESIEQSSREDLYVMGDLNINGDNCDPSDEWQRRFNKPGSFFSHPLYDTWSWTTSPEDCGATVTGGTGRLDYILGNKHGFPHQNSNEEINCVQHITRPIFESDHRAVFADINRPAPRCNPRVAQSIHAEPHRPYSAYDFQQSGSLRFAGSMQWYRIDEPGTYTIRLPKSLTDGPAQLAIDMYDKTDLTYPIEPYYGEIEDGFYRHIDSMPEPVLNVTYHSPEPPFYLRVYSKNRSFHGSYYFYVHRHSCMTKEDACTIGPNEEPRDPGLTPDSAGSGGPVWFRGKIDRAYSGQPQDLRFYVQNYTGSGLAAELYDETGTILQRRSPTQAFSTTAELSVSRSESGPRQFYLVVPRRYASQFQLAAGFETNLRFFAGNTMPSADQIHLYIGDETGSDWSGSDEGWIAFYADQLRVMTINYRGADSDDYYYFDKFFAQYSMYGNAPAVGYLDEMAVYICEEEWDDLNECSARTLWDLGPTQTEARRLQTDFAVGNGDYHLRYNLTRKRLNR